MRSFIRMLLWLMVVVLGVGSCNRIWQSDVYNRSVVTSAIALIEYRFELRCESQMKLEI